MACCSEFVTCWKGNSPYWKNIVDGYYDGPISGILQCRDCAKDYCYEILAWDSEQNSRLFALSLLPLGSFEKIENILSTIVVPRYPDWVVFRSELSDEQWNKVLETIAAIKQKVTKVSFLVIGSTPTGAIRARCVDDRLAIKVRQEKLNRDQIGKIEEWYKYFAA